MKTLRILLFSTFLLLLLSCTKDEIEVSNGYVEYNDQKSSLNFGYIEKIPHEAGIQYRLYLSDRKINMENGVIKNAEYIDNLVAFILHNPNSNYEKISDYYPLRTEQKNINISSNIAFLVGSKVILNIDPAENKDENSEYQNFIWNDGSITLASNGDEFEINFSLKNNNRVIKGEYVGMIKDVYSN